MSRDGAHTHGPQGGGLVLVVIIAALAIGSGAAAGVGRALVTIAVIITWIAASAFGLAAVTGLLIWRARSGLRRSDRPGRPGMEHLVSAPPPESRPQLSPEHKKAIEPPREIHLYLNVSPDQLAAILRHYTEEK